MFRYLSENNNLIRTTKKDSVFKVGVILLLRSRIYAVNSFGDFIYDELNHAAFS